MQVGMTKDQGLYNRPSAAVHPGALAAGTLPQYINSHCIYSRQHRISGGRGGSFMHFGPNSALSKNKLYKHFTFISLLITITIIFVIISAIFIFSKKSKPSVWPNQRPIQLVLGSLSPRVKRQDSDTHLLVPRL